jgi:hypothetical protein
MSDILKKIFGDDRKTFRHMEQRNSTGPHFVNHIWRFICVFGAIGSSGKLIERHMSDLFMLTYFYA